jgi:hypothetical protein
VAAALPLGLLPPPVQLLGGFSAFIKDPRRMAELSALREEPAEEKAHEWDSHPPTAQRIAAILALPDDGRPLDDSDVHAVGLLADPAAVLAAIGTRMLGEHAAGKTAADWDTLARAVGAAAAHERSRPLIQAVGTVTGGPAGLTDLLDLVDAGRFGEVLDRLPPSEAAKRAKATGRAAREFARTAAGPMLGGWASLQLLQQGRASLRHSWAKASGELVMPAELESELDAAIGAVLAAKPDTAPLRAVISTTQRSDTEVPA